MAFASGLFQAIGLCCFLLVSILALVLDTPGFAAFAAGAFLVGTSCAFIGANLSDRRAGIDYMLWFFFTFFVALPACVQGQVGVYPWRMHPSPRTLALTFGLVSSALLSYQVAYSIGLRVRTRHLSTGPTGRGPENPYLYTIWAWGCALFSTALMVAAGPSRFLQPRFAAHAVDTGGIGTQLTFVARSVALLAIVILLFLVRGFSTGKLKRQNEVAIALFIPVLCVLNYPPALPRFMLFGVLIALCCPFVDFSQPNSKVLTTLTAVPVLFLVFPVIKELGRGELDLLGGVRARVGATLATYLLRVDFDGFAWVAMTIEYLQGGGALRLGNNFLGVLLFFVPRSLWPGKPRDTGEIVSTALGFSYNNVASPLPAEALVAFGPLGPMLVFALAGYVFARVETVGVARGRRLSRLVLHALLMGFVVIILRGALNGVAPQFASGFLVYFLMMASSRFRVSRVEV